jgi:hypothetical protein
MHHAGDARLAALVHERFVLMDKISRRTLGVVLVGCAE